MHHIYSTCFDQIKLILPSNAARVIQYFEVNCIHRKIRWQLFRSTLRYYPPLFPPQLWSVYELVELGYPRTQNINTLIGKAHVGIYTIIEEMRKEQQTNIQIENIIRGEPQSPENRIW